MLIWDTEKQTKEMMVDHRLVILLEHLTLCLYVEYGGAVVRTPGLKSQGCEFDSHWGSTLATLGKLLT